MCELLSTLISKSKILNQKEFYYSLLKNIQDQLQEYAIKNRSLKLNLKNSR